MHAGHSVWNLHARENYLLSGDESGRVVLWALEHPGDQGGRRHYGSTPSGGAERIIVHRLACWSTAMLGSFQCCYLDQVCVWIMYLLWCPGICLTPAVLCCAAGERLRVRVSD